MSDGNLYTRAATQTLLARELAYIAPLVTGVYGNFGLLLRPCSDAPAAMPAHRLGACLVLSVDAVPRLHGDVCCDPQALPFAGESLKLVIAQHVLEQIGGGDACVTELARVLAPEGVALIFGFNPYGSWRPWLMWQQRRSASRLRLRSARATQELLAREQIDTLQVRFPGTLWPRATSGSTQGPDLPLARCGSSWLLVARKRRSTLTPLRSRTVARDVALAPRLVPGARRECA